MYSEEDNNLSHVQRRTYLRFLIKNFPKMKVNMDGASLIQSMVKRQTGCLLRLANLIVISVESVGSYIKKRFYRANCQCSFGQMKCHRYSLLDSVKANDDLSRHPYLGCPKCMTCKVSFSSDTCADQYGPYKLLKVQSALTKQDGLIDVFVEGDDCYSKSEGSVLEGLFFLDSFSKLGFKGGRLIGTHTKVLIGVQLTKYPFLEISRGKLELSIIFKAKQAKNYLNNPIVSEEALLVSVLTSTAVTNVKRFMRNICSPMGVPPIFEMLFLQMCLWHSHNPLDNEGEGILLSAILSEPTRYTNETILNSKVSSSKLNFLIFCTDQGTFLRRLDELSKGILNLEILPAIVDDRGLRDWLLVNSRSVIVIPYFTTLSSKLKNILLSTIESGKLVLEEGISVQMKASFILLVGTKDDLAHKKHSEFKSWSVVDCFDVVMDFNETSQNHAVSPSLNTELDNMISLYSTGSCSKSQLQDPSKDKSVSGLSTPLSQNSRLSMMCNRICQKFAPKQAQPVSTVLSDREFVQAAKCVLGYVSVAKEDERISQKNVVTIKKLAISCRMLRSFFLDEPSTLDRILHNESRGIFECEPIDAVFACMIFEYSRLTASPNFRPVFPQKASLFVQALNNCTIGMFNRTRRRENSESKEGMAMYGPGLEELVEEVREGLLGLVNYYV